ncbi:MAG: divergent polysaccharide deacetylase family protein, partial [Gammaproteobacteria bacterium]|nr:divergent polysaccharide deacetylase family protein [Gammaproteobacteria bacterium]NNJ83594.1 divergent polysaccharide deacetylase family protein [Gammaproteobacteria bacterium]
LGHLRVAGLRALNLPGNLSFSFIPKAPHAQELAGVAHELGKDILLHIPMESEGGHFLGPAGLTKEMTRTELTESVCASIWTIPHAQGLSNHMGSLLTRKKRSMRWLMEAMLECGEDLYFIDSQTTGKTVAAATAREYEIPTLERDIFLDHEPSTDFILAKLRQLVELAKRQGTALGIAHPYPETLNVLERVLPQLEDWGVTLVPVSILLAKRTKLLARRTNR